jgi:translation initiation factor 5B
MLEIIKENVFNKKSPILMGVNIKAGILRVGTPICVPTKDNIRIGVIDSIHCQGKPLQTARAKDGPVSIKIDGGDSTIMYGRQFDYTNQLASWQTRDSIDALKHYFRDDLVKEDWVLVLKLKKLYGII